MVLGGLSNSCYPMDCSPARLLCPCGFSRQEYWSGLLCPLPRDLPNPGIKPRSPTLQVDSLPSEPLEKAKNTGVGSLSLLQGIFPTQELNQGLLHCMQILYQPELPGNPIISILRFKSTISLFTSNFPTFSIFLSFFLQKKKCITNYTSFTCTNNIRECNKHPHFIKM